MTRTHFLRTTLVSGRAATALAFAAAAGVAGAAHAEPLCLPTQHCPSGSPTPAPTTEPSKAPPAKKAPAPAPAPPVAPAKPPAAPAPAAPAVPTAAPAPAVVATERSTAAPSPSATAVRTAVPATASGSPSRSAASPTAESNWNKPIEKAAKASHAAAVSTGGRSTGGSMGVFAIMGGVLLVGFAGLVFALWTRNRLAGHW